MNHLTDKALAVHLTSRALLGVAECFPERFAGKVPRIVRTVRPICGDGPGASFRIPADVDLYAWVNRLGAVSAITADGQLLGLYPHEFAVIEFVDPNAAPGIVYAVSEPSPTASVPAPSSPRQDKPMVARADILFSIEIEVILTIAAVALFLRALFVDGISSSAIWCSGVFVVAAAIVGICRELRARGRTHSDASPDHHGR